MLYFFGFFQTHGTLDGLVPFLAGAFDFDSFVPASFMLFRALGLPAVENLKFFMPTLVFGNGHLSVYQGFNLHLTQTLYPAELRTVIDAVPP